MPQAQKITQKDSVEESTKLKATTKVDSNLQQLLCGEEGFMRPGAMPGVSTSSAAGTKQLLDKLAQATWFKTIFMCLFHRGSPNPTKSPLGVVKMMSFF